MHPPFNYGLEFKLKFPCILLFRWPSIPTFPSLLGQSIKMGQTQKLTADAIPCRVQSTQTPLEQSFCVHA